MPFHARSLRQGASCIGSAGSSCSAQHGCSRVAAPRRRSLARVRGSLVPRPATRAPGSSLRGNPPFGHSPSTGRSRVRLTWMLKNDSGIALDLHAVCDFEHAKAQTRIRRGPDRAGCVQRRNDVRTGRSRGARKPYGTRKGFRNAIEAVRMRMAKVDRQTSTAPAHTSTTFPTCDPELSTTR
jgi:hypothetical protein